MSKIKLTWIYRIDQDGSVEAYVAEKEKYKAVAYQLLKDKDGNPIPSVFPSWSGFVEHDGIKEWTDVNNIYVDPESVQLWCERKIFDLEMANSGNATEASILKSYAFVLCGRWIESSTVQSGITFELTAHAKDRVIYAFVVDSQVQYVGVCEKDTTSLDDRMKRYKSRAGSGTNERIAIEIRQCLAQGKSVEIFALKPSAIFNYEGLFVDLVKGLENPLFEKFEPDWNL